MNDAQIRNLQQQLADTLRELMEVQNRKQEAVDELADVRGELEQGKEERFKAQKNEVRCLEDKRELKRELEQLHMKTLSPDASRVVNRYVKEYKVLLKERDTLRGELESAKKDALLFQDTCECLCKTNDTLKRELEEAKQSRSDAQDKAIKFGLERDALKEPPVIAINLGEYGKKFFEPAIIAADPTLLDDGSFGYTIDMRSLGYEGLAHIKISR